MRRSGDEIVMLVGFACMRACVCVCALMCVQGSLVCVCVCVCALVKVWMWFHVLVCVCMCMCVCMCGTERPAYLSSAAFCKCYFRTPLALSTKKDK